MFLVVVQVVDLAVVLLVTEAVPLTVLALKNLPNLESAAQIQTVVHPSLKRWPRAQLPM